MSQTVLITGATGSTGRSTTETLVKQGVTVRALVHKEDERSARLRVAGAEIVVGDLLNLDDARRALEGVNAAYFVYPIHPGLIEASAYFVQAAKEAGVGAIVNMSQISARRESKKPCGTRPLDHRALVRSVQHSRYSFAADLLRAKSPLFQCFKSACGTWRNQLPTQRRAARTHCGGMSRPAHCRDSPGNRAPHADKTYKGHVPVEMDFFAIADVISEAVGRTVKYQPIPRSISGAKAPRSRS